MDCEQYTELMSAALDGELTASRRRALEAHLAICPRCAARWDDLRAQSAALRELDCPVPEGLKESILRELPPQERPRPAYWKRWAAACACLAAVLGVALVCGRLGGATAGNAAQDPMASSAPMESGPSGTANESGQDYASGSSSVLESPSAASATVCALAPGALPEGITLLDSREALAQLLATLPAEKRDALTQTHGEDYFAHAALAALVVSAVGEPRLCSLARTGP